MLLFDPLIFTFVGCIGIFFRIDLMPALYYVIISILHYTEIVFIKQIPLTLQVYRHCAELDSSGLKDPKMHETTKISALFNLGRLYADDGSYKVSYAKKSFNIKLKYMSLSKYCVFPFLYFVLTTYEEYAICI